MVKPSSNLGVKMFKQGEANPAMYTAASREGVISQFRITTLGSSHDPTNQETRLRSRTPPRIAGSIILFMFYPVSLPELL